MTNPFEWLSDKLAARRLDRWNQVWADQLKRTRAQMIADGLDPDQPGPRGPRGVRGPDGVKGPEGARPEE